MECISTYLNFTPEEPLKAAFPYYLAGGMLGTTLGMVLFGFVITM